MPTYENRPIYEHHPIPSSRSTPELEGELADIERWLRKTKAHTSARRTLQRRKAVRLRILAARNGALDKKHGVCSECKQPLVRKDAVLDLWHPIT